MDKLLFLHREIKQTLDLFEPIPKEYKIKLLASIANLPPEKLLEVLKVLYKIEREYFQMVYNDFQETDEILKNL